jgi:hypothetical protein
MDPIALRPRKATEIIDAAIEVYRRNPIHFLLLAAIVRVPWLIVQIIYLAPHEGDPEAITTSILISAGTLLSAFIMEGFIVSMASDLYLGHETDAFRTLRKVGPRVLSIFLASLLTSLAVGFGLILFLFPAVWVTAVLFAVMPAVVVEGRSVFGAFDRSQKLSERVKGHVLSAIGLLVLIRIIVEIGSAILAALIPMPALKYVAVTAASMVVYPLYAITITLIYYDVRIRKEGFDIEMMAGRAPEAAAPASAVSS